MVCRKWVNNQPNIGTVIIQKYYNEQLSIDYDQLLELSVCECDTGVAKFDMDDTERVVEREVCDSVPLTGTDWCRDDDAIVRNIRSMATGATFIWSRSTIILHKKSWTTQALTLKQLWET